MTTMFRNRFFLQGILFGGLMGLITGTLLAFQVGNDRVENAQRQVAGWVRRDKGSFDKRLYQNIRV
jgi:hypothetical protein